MSYVFRPEQYYRMPTHFGPSLGPRQGLDDRRFACVDTPDDTVLQATFKADKAQLETLLPPGFTLREPYTITFDFSYMTNIEWLAGRGYNTFGVSIPATYNGQQETVHGDLLLVVWENKADPILTGREDLGISKIYCEIPELQIIGDEVICRASWDGFEFASLKLRDLIEMSPEDYASQCADSPASQQASEGILHYKYIPKTGCPGESDVEYAALLPDDWPNMKLDLVKHSQAATISFNSATWEQLPTLVHIVNTLSALTLGECTQTLMTKTRGAKDLSDLRILR